MVGVSDIEWCCECENAPMEIKRFDERISTSWVSSQNVCEHGVITVILNIIYTVQRRLGIPTLNGAVNVQMNRWKLYIIMVQ